MSNPKRRDNTGILFPENSKKNPKSPDYTGSATIDGKEWRIAAWVKESKNQRRKNPVTGNMEPATFQSMAFTVPKPKATTPEDEP